PRSRRTRGRRPARRRRARAPSRAEGALGDERAERGVVAAPRALEILRGVERGDPAVVHRAVDAVVQQRAAQQVVHGALARPVEAGETGLALERDVDRKSTRLNSSHEWNSYA